MFLEKSFFKYTIGFGVYSDPSQICLSMRPTFGLHFHINEGLASQKMKIGTSLVLKLIKVEN